jgi:hypothetical protein
MRQLESRPSTTLSRSNAIPRANLVACHRPVHRNRRCIAVIYGAIRPIIR